MAIRPASAFGGKDDDRTSGFTKASTLTLFGGTVVTQDTTDPTGKTLLQFAGQTALGTANPFPLGLVFEETKQFPAAPSNPDQFAGQGFDVLDYARGGVYSVFHRPGNFVEIYDDLKDTSQVAQTVNGGGTNTQNNSCPFIASDTFAVGQPVYATPGGLLTTVATSTTVRIGYVRGVSGGTGVNQIFVLELAMQSGAAIA
jgi:hypothetical protein